MMAKRSCNGRLRSQRYHVHMCVPHCHTTVSAWQPVQSASVHRRLWRQPLRPLIGHRDGSIVSMSLVRQWPEKKKGGKKKGAHPCRHGERVVCAGGARKVRAFPDLSAHLVSVNARRARDEGESRDIQTLHDIRASARSLFIHTRSSAGHPNCYLGCAVLTVSCHPSIVIPGCRSLGSADMGAG